MKLLSAGECITCQKTCVALGIFDGVHRGHRAVIGQTSEYGIPNALVPAVCTFQTATINTKGDSFRPIYSDDTKLMLIEQLGAEYVYMPDFGGIRNMSPEEFVGDILFKKMNAAAVVCGRDFRLGKNAACGTDGLEMLCSKHGIRLIVVDDVSDKGERISSAKIRKLIMNGEISFANKLLGHDYTVSGTVVEGNHIGRQLDFPTANQTLCGSFALPRFGVYASYAEIDGVIYRGVTNIGVKPTVEHNAFPLAETHFPSFSGDLYGKQLAVRLIKFVRCEKKFDSLDALRSQISEDTKSVMHTDFSVSAL